MSVVVPGLERFLRDPSKVTGRRVGLLTNPSGVDRSLQSSVNVVAAHPDIELVALYGPEHGVRGAAQAGEHVDNTVDAPTSLTMHSLYGEQRRPSREMLDPIDVMVIDIQDIGVRYATYLSTVALVLDACAESEVDVVILDRPNPLGGSQVSGNLLEEAFASFVGTHRMPVLHGLTVGEFGRMWAHDLDLPVPEVVPMLGWQREMWFDQTGLPWVLPSPNLPTLDSVALYPATCLIEGTNLSEGRGTTRPFEMVGAPWIDAETLSAALVGLNLPGMAFRPVTFTPTFSKHQGIPCHGVQSYLIDRTTADTVRFGAELLTTLKRLYPEHFVWLPGQDGLHFIDLLAGSNALRQTVDNGATLDDLLESWNADAAAFTLERQDILLY